MSRRTERRKKGKNKKTRQISVAQELQQDADAFFEANHKHDPTRAAYKKNYKKFINFCREKYRCTTKEECQEHIQDYSNFLQGKGKTASTIHTYLAPVCSYHGISMREIDKPMRKVSENVRSRDRADKYQKPSQQYDNPEYSLVANFQARVGIRRAELKNLRLDALKQDESGKWCIEVRNGKGGKYQLQRLLPEDIEYIQTFFVTPNSTDKLFHDDDFSKDMDYHHLRALQAQRAYSYYYDLTHNADGSINAKNAYELRGELMKRWNAYNHDANGKPRKFPFNDTKGTYKLRGANRQYALKNGLPLEYDKLCVMAVSIFHLSHWRLDTLTNYLLAI